MPGPHLKLRHSLEKGSQTWHRLAREKYAAACVPTPWGLRSPSEVNSVKHLVQFSCRATPRQRQVARLLISRQRSMANRA